MKEEILRKYAELIVKTGIALKKGQPVVIQANVGIEPFTAMVVEECYKTGASRVVVNWSSEAINRIALTLGDQEELAKVFPLEEAMERWKTDDLPALIWLDPDDPDSLNGVDNPMDAAKLFGVLYEVLSPFRERTMALFYGAEDKDVFSCKETQAAVVGLPHVIDHFVRAGKEENAKKSMDRLLTLFDKVDSFDKESRPKCGLRLESVFLNFSALYKL